MYKDLAREVGISESRAKTIAQSEITRVHAEGQLDAFDSLGVTRLGVMAEWMTADDDRVCDACAELDDVVMTVEEARGLLPRHPNCRCAWVAANVGEEDDKDNQQIRGKSAIEQAIEDSLDAEGRGNKTTWPGADVSISKARPEGIFNAGAEHDLHQAINEGDWDRSHELEFQSIFNSQDLLQNYQQGQSEIIDRLDQVIDLLGITDSSLPLIENRSFFVECERDEHGYCLPEGTSESKSQAATRTYKPSTVEKQRKGESEQLLLSKAIGGLNTEDTKPFDVLVGSNGIEVKTVIDNDNDKITVHPESRIRKEQEAKRLKLKTHTVAIDTRSGRRVYYYRSGVGSFRLSSMERVSLTKLKEILQ
jgi:SPP1 gp7 family putative phage head morphogenesis protein